MFDDKTKEAHDKIFSILAELSTSQKISCAATVFSLVIAMTSEVIGIEPTKILDDMIPTMKKCLSYFETAKEMINE